ncbi:MAG: hypothetical protein M3Y27_01110, partial [Acidobacteriota bacterium]|nr:hypothetical protein [Acidobacteriota bacterium]
EAPEQLREQIMKNGLKHEFAVDLTAIKQALNLEQKVSGADLSIKSFLPPNQLRKSFPQLLSLLRRLRSSVWAGCLQKDRAGVR